MEKCFFCSEKHSRIMYTRTPKYKAFATLVLSSSSWQAQSRSSSIKTHRAVDELQASSGHGEWV